jgi:hypothetical protein
MVAVNKVIMKIIFIIHLFIYLAVFITVVAPKNFLIVLMFSNIF